MGPGPGSGSNARWRTLDRRTYPSTVFTTGALSPLTGEAYDAVLSFAYALDYNAQAGRNLTSANLMQALRDVWFTGTHQRPACHPERPGGSWSAGDQAQSFFSSRKVRISIRCGHGK